MSVHIPDEEDSEDVVVDLEATGTPGGFSKGRYSVAPTQSAGEESADPRPTASPGTTPSSSVAAEPSGWSKYERRASGGGAPAEPQATTDTEPAAAEAAERVPEMAEELVVDLEAAADDPPPGRPPSSFYERQLKEAVARSREGKPPVVPEDADTYYQRRSAKLPRIREGE